MMDGRQDAFIGRALDIALGAVPAGPSDFESRAFKRWPCTSWIAFIGVDGNGVRRGPFTMRTREISAGGLRATGRHDHAMGSAGAVLIHRQSGPSVLLGASIVHCQAIGEGRYEYGLRFVRCAAGVTIDHFRNADGQLPDLGAPRAA